MQGELKKDRAQLVNWKNKIVSDIEDIETKISDDFDEAKTTAKHGIKEISEDVREARTELSDDAKALKAGWPDFKNDVQKFMYDLNKKLKS